VDLRATCYKRRKSRRTCRRTRDEGDNGTHDVFIDYGKRSRNGATAGLELSIIAENENRKTRLLGEKKLLLLKNNNINNNNKNDIY